MKNLMKQFLKFGIVGIINTLSSTCYYWVFVYINVNYMISTIIAYLLASFIGFILNKKWVFKKKNESSNTIVRYYIVYGSALLLNLACMYLWVDILSISEYIAPIITLFITVPYNFILSRNWVYK